MIVSDAGTGGFQQGIASFVQRLTDRAELGLVSVLPQPEVVTNFTSDAAVLREGVRRLGVRGRQDGAQVMEAIQEATKGVVSEGQRPVILVLRVGVEGTTPLDGADVRERLRRSGAMLYVISTASAARRPPSSARTGISAEQSQLHYDEIAASRRNLAEVLGDGARESGGRHDEIVATTSVSPALAAHRRRITESVRGDLRRAAGAEGEREAVGHGEAEGREDPGAGEVEVVSATGASSRRRSRGVASLARSGS